MQRIRKRMWSAEPKARAESFRLLTERFCELAGREGIWARPSGSQGPVYFRCLPDRLQLSTLDHFHRFLEVCEEAQDAGNRLADDRSFLWRMFRKLGVHPVSTLLAEIDDNDVIEIYNADFIQVFRNLKFFTLCSYTLDDLLCRPFWELFQREERITRALLSVAGDIYSKTVEGIQRLDLGRHFLVETDGPRRLRSEVENRIVCPLYNTAGDVAALVSVIRPISCQSTLQPTAQKTKEFPSEGGA